jgi:hypothetical protein
MGLLDRLRGYRWSLYIVTNGNELRYVIHENSVVRILGYVMGSYARNGNPRAPWSLHLNFNRDHTSFPLVREHFTADGENLSPLLLDKLKEIDPKFDTIAGGEPVVLDAATKKQIKISNARMFAGGDIGDYFKDMEARSQEVRRVQLRSAPRLKEASNIAWGVR